MAALVTGISAFDGLVDDGSGLISKVKESR